MKGLRGKAPFIALLGWVALIFVFSSQPYQKQSIQPALHRAFSEHKAEEMLPSVDFVYDDTDYSSRIDPFAVMEFLFRKAAHLFMYGMLAILAAFSIGSSKKLMRSITIPVALVIAVASLDEWNQSRIPGRTPNPQDIVVDTIGACLGLVVFFAARYCLKRYKTNPRLIK